MSPVTIAHACTASDSLSSVDGKADTSKAIRNYWSELAGAPISQDSNAKQVDWIDDDVPQRKCR